MLSAFSKHVSQNYANNKSSKIRVNFDAKASAWILQPCSDHPLIHVTQCRNCRTKQMIMHLMLSGDLVPLHMSECTPTSENATNRCVSTHFCLNAFPAVSPQNRLDPRSQALLVCAHVHNFHHTTGINNYDVYTVDLHDQQELAAPSHRTSVLATYLGRSQYQAVLAG